MLQAHLFRGSTPGSAGVVDQDIDSSETAESDVHDLLDGGGIRDVAAEADGGNSERLQFFRRFLAPLFFSSAKDKIRAHLRESFSHLAPQPRGAAGNNGHAASQIKKVS